ncbi:lactonase family protein [Gillisia limnaea]|uniref:6-phosphogluconolactonase n=1 Tax=Gillisia limnaea (strain DSM 15749 / LMG 21470 / R-8282) TaxID=865937 RepID=H2BQT7_GILLR|nr:lactonase family protein [Gillisia limnaea]EHQ04256.1 6-phosphogluconolactonase [Gillisia limnaea DSM 15749]
MKPNMILLLAFAIIHTNSKGQNTIANENVEATPNVMYVGTYTKKEGHVNGQANGIYSVLQDPESGRLIFKETAAKITNPSFVKVSKNKQYLFAVSELGSKDAPSGFIYSYRIGEDYDLEMINKVSTESYAPCHIALDQSGNFVFVSNYVGGVVMVYKIKPDGSLKKVQRIDLENSSDSNAHSVTLSSDNKRAYIADLGNDKIWIYNFDPATGRLRLNSQAYVALSNGSGPRHFTLSANNKFAYSINEINSSVSVFSVLKEGGLKLIQNIPSLPEDFTEKNSAADIHIHPSGKFLYISNRGHNTIASYKIDKNTGNLKNIEYSPTFGKTPRNFAISENGKFLYVANQDSNTISIFNVDPRNGKLTTQLEPLEIKTPVCLEFVGA